MIDRERDPVLTGECAAPSGTVGAVVGLDHWQRWIDSRPSTDTGYLTLVIRCMIEDLLTIEQAREITTWSLGVERRKANVPVRRSGAAPGMGGMEHIRKTYNVPARRGGRIRFEGRDTGTIVAARHGRLRVRFDGQKRIAFLHPTWEVEYLPNAESEARHG